MKHRQQEKDYYCGPAVAQMILANFNIVKSQKNLALQLKTKKSNGTSHKQLVNVLKKYALTIIETKDSTIPQMKRDLAKRIVVTCYYLPKEKTGHYAIVTRITKKDIHLIDPYYGKNTIMPLLQFKKVWHGSKIPYGWYITIAKSQE
jgi:ABC-type bacteriocin/lantibiotic exporter with double-glycine peptidase domain